jgi:hypothetical protein
MRRYRPLSVTGGKPNSSSAASSLVPNAGVQRRRMANSRSGVRTSLLLHTPASSASSTSSTACSNSSSRSTAAARTAATADLTSPLPVLVLNYAAMVGGEAVVVVVIGSSSS